MTNQDILALIQTFDSSSISSMRMVSGDFSLELSRGGLSQDLPQVEVGKTVVERRVEEIREDKTNSDTTKEKAQSEKTLKAPLLGTFYVAPAPDQPPYVKKGDKVRKGDVLCLIEAMKMMSEVRAPEDLEVVETVAENGELVEFGGALLRYLPC